MSIDYQSVWIMILKPYIMSYTSFIPFNVGVDWTLSYHIQLNERLSKIYNVQLSVAACKKWLTCLIVTVTYLLLMPPDKHSEQILPSDLSVFVSLLADVFQQQTVTRLMTL